MRKHKISISKILGLSTMKVHSLVSVSFWDSGSYQGCWPLAGLLGWVRHLGAEEPQRLETLADGMNVSHAHEDHFTVRVVLWWKMRKDEVKQVWFYNTKKEN